MKHLYDNGENEIVAADTLEDAHKFYDIILGGETDPKEIAHLRKEWYQINDTALVPIENSDDSGNTVTKTAAEWAAEWEEISCVASRN